MNLIEYPDRDMMFIDLANQIAGDISSVLTHDETVALAVPGGTTPGPVFDVLCAAELHWDRVTVLLTDERWVPETDPRSNTRLVRDRLLTDRAAMATMLEFYRDGTEAEDAAPDLSRQVEPLRPLSVLLLGMGADGHTASLFPGGDTLKAALSDNAPAVMAIRAPGAPEPRVTLTRPVLAGALSTHVVITGKDKRETLERAQHGSVTDYPIRAVLSDATIHWAE